MIVDMSEVIRLRPDDAAAFYRRGLAYGERDAWDEAMADLCEAIRLDPDDADAYRGRGDCHRYQDEYDLAITDYDTALRLDTENSAAHLGRALRIAVRAILIGQSQITTTRYDSTPKNHLSIGSVETPISPKVTMTKQSLTAAGR